MMFYQGWISSSSLKPALTYGDGHWEDFQNNRKKHNKNICSETNKLVLRLDKLINPGDGQKPNLDKSVVEWTSDNLVKLCPFCARAFSFAKRRHHCRACGAILCNSCSKYLEYRSACKLVKPSKLYTDKYDRIEDSLERRSADEMPKIRCCEDCKRLLDKRIQTIEDHYCQPTFCEIYDRLRSLMIDADELILSHDSLLSEQKQMNPELKNRIHDVKHKLLETAAKLGKMADRESGKQAYLLKAINQSVLAWLEESLESKFNRKFAGQRAQPLCGWVPDQPGVSHVDVSTDDDPLLIQIKNLEEYIKQAKMADKYEEVSVLEDSKRDLEIEYLLMQQDLSFQGSEPNNTGE